jgi:hypothetical protein
LCDGSFRQQSRLLTSKWQSLLTDEIDFRVANSTNKWSSQSHDLSEWQSQPSMDRNLCSSKYFGISMWLNVTQLGEYHSQEHNFAITKHQCYIRVYNNLSPCRSTTGQGSSDWNRRMSVWCLRRCTCLDRNLVPQKWKLHRTMHFIHWSSSVHISWKKLLHGEGSDGD